MTDDEIKKIEEGISYTYGKRGSTAEGAANVRAEYCRNLITALRAERKATEKLAEELGSECPSLRFLWEPKDAPAWCRDADRPSPGASIAKPDCYEDENECWLRLARGESK